jgi:hypothetical protein
VSDYSRVLSILLATDLDLACTTKASRRLSERAFKKFEDDSSEFADAVAKAKFKDTCLRISAYQGAVPETMLDEYLIGEFQLAIDRAFDQEFLDKLNWSSIFLKGRTGPGASIGSIGTDFYTKLFSSNLTTCSLPVSSAFQRLVKFDYRWMSAEIIRRHSYGTPHLVSGSKMSYVPKNVDTSRTICTEPNLNMFFQLGLGSFLEDRLVTRFGIDITKQEPHNQEMCRIGSVDGMYSTIDLSSASDSISLTLCKQFLPRKLYDWLLELRSKETVLDGEVIHLPMVSTMGNGFTFPLMTMIFACCVEAVYRLDCTPLVKNRGGQHGNFAVYGDDIIIASNSYNKVLRLLKLLGFVVNTEKSFNEGTFRESCGADFDSGENITPVYIKSLSTPQARYVAFNRLAEWSAVHGISLSRTLSYLFKTVPDVRVPLWEGYDSGLRDTRPFTSLDDNGSIIYYAYRPRSMSMSTVDASLTKRKRVINPYGLYLAFLSGSLRGHRISFRSSKLKYVRRKLIAPNWSYGAYGLNSVCWWPQLNAVVSGILPRREDQRG